MAQSGIINYGCHTESVLPIWFEIAYDYFCVIPPLYRANGKRLLCKYAAVKSALVASHCCRDSGSKNKFTPDEDGGCWQSG